MRILLFVLLLSSFALSAFAADGLFNVPSQHSVKFTADRLVNLLESKGMTVFARIDHAEGASKVGLDLRPTTLVIFGNPKVGSPLMQCSQTTAIDLPQKALVWQDENGKVWLSYNEPDYLKKRHQITGCDEVLGKVSGALNGFALGATRK